MSPQKRPFPVELYFGSPTRRPQTLLSIPLALTALVSLLAATTSAQEAATPAPEVAAQAAGAPALTPELLVAHPSLVTGDKAAYRAALLDALERTPQSPFAPLAARILRGQSISDFSPEDQLRDAERISALLERVEHAETSLQLRNELHSIARVRRFGDVPVDLPEDLYPEFLTRFWVVGPLGAMDDRGPATAPAPDLGHLFEDGPLDFSPEPSPLAPALEGPQSFAPSYPAADGKSRGWTLVTRGENSTSARFQSHVEPDLGQTYAAAFVRPPADGEHERMTLEIRASGPVRAWWNGRLAIDEPRLTWQDETGILQARVESIPTGYNALLMRMPTGSGGGLSVRFLDSEGRAIPMEEDQGADGPPLWSLGAPPVALPDPELFDPMLDAALEGEPFEAPLRMMRANLAGRQDLALAEPRPSIENALVLEAFLAQRLGALQGAKHLPDELTRRLTIELTAEMRADGSMEAATFENEARRLLQEDRSTDALDVVERWIASAPHLPWPRYFRIFVLDAIDRTGVMGQAALGEFVESFPHYAAARMKLAKRLDQEDVSAAAVEHAWAALVQTGGAQQSMEFLNDVWAGTGEPRLEVLVEAARRWSMMHPGRGSDRKVLKDLLEAAGEHDLVAAMEAEETAEHPNMPEAWWALGNARLVAGDEAGAVEALERELSFRPEDETTAELLERLGRPDPVEAFFEEFAPDAEAAIASVERSGNASVIEVLDSGLVYLFPSGASRTRYRTLTMPLDRPGAEELNALPIVPGTKSIKIVGADGDIQEPTAVEGQWVLPAIEPGDLVDITWETSEEGVPGAPVEGKTWRFASSEKAFAVSRYVLFVPDALHGELVLKHFDGSHETHEREGGTVHVLTASNPQFILEPLMPTEMEVVPHAIFSSSRERRDELRSWWQYVQNNSLIPADLEGELAEFIDEATVGIPDGDQRARAKALYEAVDGYLRSFEGNEAASVVWLTEQGWPVFLLGALYERADVPFEWAVLKSQLSPELDAPSPLHFEGRRDLAQAVLRLGVQDDAGDPIWVIHSGLPGTPFGAISATMVGAPAYVMEDASGLARGVSLPRTQGRSSWDLDLELRYKLSEDGSAQVTGRTVDVTPRGATMIRQIKEATAEQRDAFARSQAASMSPGVDLTSAGIVLDGSEGPGVVLRFEGTAAEFARPRGDGFVAAIPFLPLQLDQRFGPAERRWPIALRQALRLRVRVHVEPGEHWELVGGPPATEETREGFEVVLGVTDGDGERVFEQRLEQRGLFLEPGEVPAFVARMGEVNQEFTRPLKLRRRDG